VGNPVDVIGDADPDRYVKAFEILQDDEKIDASSWWPRRRT
jgi:acyl-CoA synthetase (NDP forming)